MDGWMDGRMDGQTTDGWIDRQMDGAPMKKVKALQKYKIITMTTEIIHDE